MLNKQELKYILFATIFAFIVFVFIIPKLVSLGIENSSPYLQFLLFNTSIFIFLQLFLKSTALGNGIKISGAIGIIALFIAIDILVPPLLVNQKGELLSNVQLYASSSDYIFGYFYSSIGIQGFLLYLAVYVLTPFLLLILSAKLIPNFVKNV